MKVRTVCTAVDTAPFSDVSLFVLLSSVLFPAVPPVAAPLSSNTGSPSTVTCVRYSSSTVNVTLPVYTPSVSTPTILGAVMSAMPSTVICASASRSFKVQVLSSPSVTATPFTFNAKFSVFEYPGASVRVRLTSSPQAASSREAVRV